ncbi:MAG: hypothetical protein P1U65_17110 [Minwuia sp.]|nr:hypothetical protein [Minwuia sp.]
MATQSNTTAKTGSSTSDKDKVSPDDLRDDFDKLRADMAALVHQVAELSGDKVRDTTKAASDTARQKASDVREQANETYAAGRNWLTTQATDRPLATIAVAAAIGVVIGRMMRK